MLSYPPIITVTLRFLTPIAIDRAAEEAIPSDIKRPASQQAALCKRGTGHNQEKHTPHGKLAGWPNLLPHSNKLFYSLRDFMRLCGTKSSFNDPQSYVTS